MKNQDTTLMITRFINVLCAALLMGNNLGTAFAIFPALRPLPASHSVEVVQRITRRYRLVMPILMPATVLSCIALLLTPNRRSASRTFTVGGLAAFLGVVAITALELPLNFRALQASAAAPPSDWQELRTRWARFNRLRAALATAGFGSLLLAALTEDQP